MSAGYTYNDLMEILGVSRTAIEKRVLRLGIRGTADGRRKYFTAEDLEELKKPHKRKTGTAKKKRNQSITGFQFLSPHTISSS